jgi:hypothetical protein
VTHLQIPVTAEHHITLVHFHRALTKGEAETVLNGVEALGQVYAGLPVNAWWGFNDLMVGPANNVPASGVEFETDLLPEFRKRLVAGLITRGLPVSQDYAEWMPHITNPPRTIPPWTFIRHKGVVQLVQKPHPPIDVPFPAPAPAEP